MASATRDAAFTVEGSSTDVSVESVRLLDDADSSNEESMNKAGIAENRADLDRLIQELAPVDEEQRDQDFEFDGNPNSGRSSNVESNAEIADLHRQLGVKDELITALVGELEQVVEQLDRIQRTGVNKSQPTSPGGGALMGPIGGEHQQVLSDMQRVVEEWESLQAASILTRIESEVAEIRSLMLRGAVTPTQEGARLELPHDELDDVMSQLEQQGRNSSLADTVIEGTSWESMKRQMLGLEEADSKVASIDLEVTLADDADLGVGVAPADINFELATESELRAACAERDAYIVQLIRMVRSRRSVALPSDWSDVADVPEELRARVNQLAERLDEQVQFAEVEMSLERARLSRERTQVQHDREKIEKHLKRLGLNSLDDLESVSVENGTSSDRRWMRFLGVNRRS